MRSARSPVITEGGAIANGHLVTPTQHHRLGRRFATRTNASIRQTSDRQRPTRPPTEDLTRRERVGGRHRLLAVVAVALCGCGEASTRWRIVGAAKTLAVSGVNYDLTLGGPRLIGRTPTRVSGRGCTTSRRARVRLVFQRARMTRRGPSISTSCRPGSCSCPLRRACRSCDLGVGPAHGATGRQRPATSQRRARGSPLSSRSPRPPGVRGPRHRRPTSREPRSGVNTASRSTWRERS